MENSQYGFDCKNVKALIPIWAFWTGTSVLAFSWSTRCSTFHAKLKLIPVNLFLFFFSLYRRYVAMVGMCKIVGHRSRLIMLLLLLAQNLMNIILAHFKDWYNCVFLLFCCSKLILIHWFSLHHMPMITVTLWKQLLMAHRLMLKRKWIGFVDS